MGLDRLFYPRSIAVVGASPGMAGGRLPYYQVIRNNGFSGPLYPVNPSREEIDGDKVYPSLEDIPGELDLVIVQAPVRAALDVLRSAVEKEARFVHYFTSGFSEIGDKALEEAMLDMIQSSRTRIVGPNCIGVYCQGGRVTFGPRIEGNDPGTVAFMAQSGGVTLNFLRLAQSRKLPLNKIVSYGNQIDVGVDEFIDYFGRDDEIKVIAAYIEDVKKGRAFIEALRETTPRKPVVILRGGITDEGARAAASHTGALCGHQKIFSSAIRQHGGLEVRTIEELLDVVGLCLAPKRPAGRRLGYLGAGGGTSVLFTDLAAQHGFTMPELKESTQAAINERIPPVNTSAANPVDLGAFGRSFEIMAHTMKAMDRDDRIDFIMAYFSVEYVRGMADDKLLQGVFLIRQTIKSMDKPVMPIFAKFSDNELDIEETRIRIFSIFRQAGLPVFESLRDALTAMDALLPA